MWDNLIIWLSCSDDFAHIVLTVVWCRPPIQQARTQVHTLGTRIVLVYSGGRVRHIWSKCSTQSDMDR